MKTIIVEDELPAVKRLQKILSELEEDVEVLDCIDGIEGFVNWYNNNDHEIDFILLDIHLSDGLSFEIFDLVNIDEPVVFTTAYDQYAINAFKVHAVDYLLKPIKKEELQYAINLVKKRKNSHVVDYKKLVDEMLPNKKKKRFLIKIGHSFKLVDLDSAAYIFTKDKITYLVNNQGRKFPLDLSLEKIESMMDKEKYFRINRQIIVKIDAISEMLMYSKSRVKLILKPACDLETVVSTERSPHFKKWLIEGSSTG